MTTNCECCQKEVAKEDFPLGDGICENCCNEMLLGSLTPSFDWGQFDFEKGDFK